MCPNWFPGNWQSIWCQFPLQILCLPIPLNGQDCCHVTACCLPDTVGYLSRTFCCRLVRAPFSKPMMCGLFVCLLRLDNKTYRCPGCTTQHHLWTASTEVTTTHHIFFLWTWWTHWLIFLVPVRTCCSIPETFQWWQISAFSYCSRETWMSNSSTLTTLILI